MYGYFQNIQAVEILTLAKCQWFYRQLYDPIADTKLASVCVQMIDFVYIGSIHWVCEELLILIFLELY
jgi:hypothetical protein